MANQGRIKNPIIVKPVIREPIYGVAIDKNNSNPETSVTYTHDAVGLQPSSGGNGAFVDNGWDDRFPFNEIKPVLLQAGTELGDLNKNNYASWSDGHTPAPDISSGDGGDVMIKFPYMHYQITQDDNNYYVRYSKEAFTGSTDWAFDYGGVIKDAFYIGAYHGVVDENSRLRSLSGRIPTASQTIGWFRTRAKNNGAGYEQLPWNKLILLQVLYLIRFKSLNSQAALGMGWTSTSNTTSVTTGVTNAYGFNYGTSLNVNGRLKFNGIEDFYGNVLNWCDGIVQMNSGSVRTSTSNFNDTGTGYVQKATYGATVSGYITKVQGNNDLGFLITVGGGSTSTYFSDDAYCIRDTNTAFPVFGGQFNAGLVAGMFRLNLSYSPSSISGVVSSRLCFCG